MSYIDKMPLELLKEILNIKHEITSTVTMTCNAEVLENVLSYCRTLLMEISLEVTKIFNDTIKNSDFMLELNASGVLKTEMMSELFKKVEEKQKYFSGMIVKAMQQSTCLQIPMSELKKLKKEDRTKMIEKLIRENRNAANAKVMVDNLKREWDLAKENVEFDVKEFIEKAQELLNNRKNDDASKTL